MKLIRYCNNIKDNINYGTLDDKSGMIHELEGSYFDSFARTGNTLALEEVNLLSPVHPGKIVGVGLNYRDHAKEFGLSLPDEPMLFLKPSTTVIDPGSSIIYPEGSKRVDFEGELAIIIGSQVKGCDVDEASKYIFGYTCANDITARDLQKKDGQWSRAKSFDTFLPVGPCIETEVDPANLQVQTYVNGEEKQNSNTSEMVFNVYELVSFISSIMTLEPGDVIITGTPPGVGPLSRGDQVEVKIQNIGVLKNDVL
ncbi:fumarylacetoacetate hydrolase family protein [Natranaerofaba carboxydovora]|uniref:fumarylacetoacetate hydrolase family protein n=1 Tax=Natranaerofaba carboxydovora TaxID=2742683 RepID=UPI001F12CB90|nr:fumarylacetoacetate hydrolase family protein [Natranaerofaba carboxydovora]UMZ74873.1 Ureidoglycolate lyase [Natranaerofaba carboxydovora]